MNALRTLGNRLPILALTLAGLIAGCAASSEVKLPPPLPEGKGQLLIEAGGIMELNFSVIDQETQEVVYSTSPRPSPLSPSAFQRQLRESQLKAYLDPGIYTLVVNTDFESDIIEVVDIEIVQGERKWVSVQIGSFMVIVTRDNQPEQARFVVYDYNMRSILGQGMTSTQVRHFVARPGIYKLRIENMAMQTDVIREFRVNMGSVYPVRIELLPSSGDESEQNTGTQQ